jgi:hypothetical protein
VRHGWICLLLASGFAAAQTATTTSLVSSPNPANLGQVVTLTATVTSGATGKVTFYDQTTVLGIASVAGGQATLATSLLLPGPHSLLARYDGDSNYNPSLSAARALSVSARTLSGYRPSTSYLVTRPNALAVGDFNHDGKPDLVTADSQGSGISVLLGTGDGSLQSVVNYSLGPNIVSLAVRIGDLNGDGNADVAVLSLDAGISLFLGNGDGTFQTPIQPVTSVQYVNFVIADFDGDGKLDIAATTGAGVDFLSVMVTAVSDPLSRWYPTSRT